MQFSANQKSECRGCGCDVRVGADYCRVCDGKQPPARKPDWWWDVTWNPVSGCFYVSPGCTNCFVPSWLRSHTWHNDNVHTGVTKLVNGRAVFTGKLTVAASRASVPWTCTARLARRGAFRKLGAGQLHRSFAIRGHVSDLFHEDRAVARRYRLASMRDDHALWPHIGPAAHEAHRADGGIFRRVRSPRTVRPVDAHRLWLGFSAGGPSSSSSSAGRNMRRLAECQAWFVFVSLAPLLATGDAAARLSGIAGADVGDRGG